MQHLIDAIQATAKSRSWLPKLPADLQLIAQFLDSGDERLIPALACIPDQHVAALDAVASAMPRPDAWQEPDRRLLRLFVLRSETLTPTAGRKPSDWRLGDDLLAESMRRWLHYEAPDEDWFRFLRDELLRLGCDEIRLVDLVAGSIRPLANDRRLTSAGRYLAARPAREFADRIAGLELDFLGALAATHPHTAEAVAEQVVASDRISEMPGGGWLELLDSDSAKFEALLAAAFRGVRYRPAERVELGARLAECYPGKYEAELWQAACDALYAEPGPPERAPHAQWMLEHQGAEASLPQLVQFIAQWQTGVPWFQSTRIEVLQAVVEKLGDAARPVIAAGLQSELPALRRAAIETLIGLRNPADEAEIEERLGAELKVAGSAEIPPGISIAVAWNLPRMAPRLWELLGHKSKLVRAAAAAALARLGDAAIGKATEALTARKSDLRAAAASLLGQIGSDAAIDPLRAALETEKSADVADAIRAALPVPAETAGASSIAPGGAMSREAVLASIKRAVAKGKVPAGWVALEQLPPLTFLDGTALDLDAVRYLLYRQSRSKTMDPDTEARPLYALIDRGGDFALAVLQGFLGSGADAGDRWALAIAGLLGDDRIVPILTRQIGEWADTSRGKLAEYGVQALALHASDAALLAVDALAIRYRTKFKNIGKAAAEAFAKAAESRGLSTAELGDRVVPWLGFAPGQPRVIECAATPVEVSIGLDFKVSYRDSAKRKRTTSLPGSASAAIKAEMKDLAAVLKEAVKAQLLRLENLMVQQHRWPAIRWRELFLQHPLLVPFAVRLVWGAYDAGGALGSTFRALEDRTLTNASDEPVEPPASGSIGIVHPLELDTSSRQAWRQHLADYDLVPPFAQLERAVIAPTAEQSPSRFLLEVEGTELNAMTFRGRAEKRGWFRGSVCDGGHVPTYYKPFAEAGVDVFLRLDGMYIGIDMYSSIKLLTFFFIRHGSVSIGSYIYDEPGNESDPRLLAAGEVPPIAFSEALGDVRHIAGKAIEAGV